MSVSDVESECSELSDDLDREQRAQSATVQRLDLLLGYSELNEFETCFHINEQREKLYQERHRLFQKIKEREAQLRRMYEALAKDHAKLAANGKQIEALDQLEFDPSSLNSHLAKELLRDKKSSDSVSQWSASSSPSQNPGCKALWVHDQLPGAATTMPDLPEMPSDIPCIKVWPKPPGAVKSMPDLPVMSTKSADSNNDHDGLSECGDADLDSSNDLCCLARKIGHQLPNAVKTMPDLPQMTSIIEDSESVASCEDNESQQSHHVLDWRPPPGAAISMPDLPMISDECEDTNIEPRAAAARFLPAGLVKGARTEPPKDKFFSGWTRFGSFNRPASVDLCE